MPDERVVRCIEGQRFYHGRGSRLEQRWRAANIVPTVEEIVLFAQT